MKGSNVIAIERAIPPIPTGMNISQQNWNACSAEMRSEIVRMWQEGNAGLAIYKDRRCGRPKSHRSRPRPAVSFYELHQLEFEAWRWGNLSPAEIARAAELREALASDVERMQQNDGLEEYHELAAKNGTTLAAALHRYTNMENLLKEDLTAGLKAIARNAGLDLTAWAHRQLEADCA
jgi:hypothetical protein